MDKAINHSKTTLGTDISFPSDILTDKEKLYMKYVASGMPNSEIYLAMDLESEEYCDCLRKRVCKKLNAKNLVNAAYLCAKSKLIGF